jgi:hypothetical protein
VVAGLVVGALVAGMAPVTAQPGPAATPVTAARSVPTATPSTTVTASATGDFKVTLVARTCSRYDAIMANRARNNIQESLADLGPDSIYSYPSEVINPDVEDVRVTSQRDNCTPLVNWPFTLGRAYTGKKPTTDNLSTVTGPFAGTPTTLASVPRLDDLGRPIAGQSVAGAVTIPLTDEQASLAGKSNSLWIQGGTVTDPLLNSGTPPFNPPQGFGSLRCSTDYLNGDNVEWIGFKAGARHAFCYYFAVSPAADAATIVVKKTVRDQPGLKRDFDFAGNVSYNPNPSGNPDNDPFRVANGGAVTFIRAAGERNWNFHEVSDPDYPLQDVVCTKTNAATVIENPGAATAPGNPVRITALAAGDTVTCEFINAEKPPPPANARLSVDKVTDHGTGTFDIRIDNPEVPAVTTRVTTEDEGTPTSAGSLEGPAPAFTIRETLPAGTDPDAWTLRRVACDNGFVVRRPLINRTMRIPAGAGESLNCTLFNRPNGRIDIRKTTKGSFGTFNFAIVPIRNDATVEDVVGMSATTDNAGDTATARPVIGSNRGLAFGRYAVVELDEPSPIGTWTLESVRCVTEDGRRFRSARLPGVPGAILQISPKDPTATCTFVNRFTADLGESRSATLDVSKVVRGPEGTRTSDVVIDVTCDDGQAKQLRMDPATPGSQGWALPMEFGRFPGGAVQCQIVESATGAAPNVAVATQIRIDTGRSVTVRNATRATVTIEPKDRVEVVVRDTYEPITGCSGSDCDR